jgi:hypothetical protein
MLNWKALVATLGVAGLGLGVVATGGPAAQAQQQATPTATQSTQPTQSMQSTSGGQGPMAQRSGMRQQFYTEFTAALAKELGNNTTSDEADAAIRKALMSMIDAHVADGTFTYGQGEALKTLIATSQAPLAPGLLVGMGMGPGGYMNGEHGYSPGEQGGIHPGGWQNGQQGSSGSEQNGKKGSGGGWQNGKQGSSGNEQTGRQSQSHGQTNSRQKSDGDTDDQNASG